MEDRIKRNREAIKPKWTDLYSANTAKKQGKQRPEQFKSVPGAKKIDLLKKFPNIKTKTLQEAIASRRSLRSYSDINLSFEELSYLLWETCRVESHRENAVFRTIPTAGATNSMETYVFINKVQDIEKGVYLYLQESHSLALIDNDDLIGEFVNEGLLKQLRNAPLVFFFTCIPARTEYKYDFCAHKMIAIEAGHACQNLSLAAEAIDSGACAICAYDQEKLDKILKLDGEEHFTIYCATVGKK